MCLGGGGGGGGGGDKRWRGCLRHDAKILKVAGSVPNGVNIGFLIDFTLPVGA